MKRTVTLTPDVVRRLRRVAHDRRLTFKETVNAALRSGLDQMLAKPKAGAFRTEAEDMGIYPHLNYDNIGELLEVQQKARRRFFPAAR